MAADGCAAAVAFSEGPHPQVQAINEPPVHGDDLARLQRLHDVHIRPRTRTDQGAAVEAWPEVAVLLGRSGVDRGAATAGGVVVLGAGLEGVGEDLVAVGGGGDPPRFALGQQGVPQAADLGRHPVEPAVGAVRVLRGGGVVAGEAVRVGGLVVVAAGFSDAASGGRDSGGLVARRAFHADGDLRGRVAPAADFVGAVQAPPRGVVGEHQRDLGAAGSHLPLQELQRLERVGFPVRRGRSGDQALTALVGRRGQDVAVVARFERAQDVDGVASWRQEYGGVLGTGDVPLQPLIDQDVPVGLAGALDVRRDLVDRELLVRHAAVVGDDHPVQPVLASVGDLRGDLVLRVRGELGVDVMITGQPSLRATPGVHYFGGGTRGARGRGRRAERDRSGGQAQSGEELPPRDGQRSVIGRIGPTPFDRLVLVMVVTVLVVTVAMRHVGSSRSFKEDVTVEGPRCRFDPARRLFAAASRKYCQPRMPGPHAQAKIR